MITFKKKSLHYKFNNLVKGIDFCADATHCKSLCSYFWSTIYNLIAMTLTPFVMFTIFTLYGCVIASLLWSLDAQPIDLTYLWLVGVVGIAATLAAFLVPSLIIDKCKEESPDKEPSVVREWVKAKKAKVCPMIKFED